MVSLENLYNLDIPFSDIAPFKFRELQYNENETPEFDTDTQFKNPTYHTIALYETTLKGYLKTWALYYFKELLETSYRSKSIKQNGITKDNTIYLNYVFSLPIDVIHTQFSKLHPRTFKIRNYVYAQMPYYKQYILQLNIFSQPETTQTLYNEILGCRGECINFLKENHESMEDYTIAEYNVAKTCSGIVWNHLTQLARKTLYGDEESGYYGRYGDHGIDVVSPEGNLYQVKYFGEGKVIKIDAIAKLNNIAEVYESVGGFVPNRYMVGREVNHMNERAPGSNRIEYITQPDVFEYEEVKEEKVISSYVGELKEKLDALHDKIIGKVMEKINEKEFRICLPTGTGKSIIIKRLCEEVFTDYYNVVSAPRVDIVRQLKQTLHGLNNAYVNTLQSANNTKSYVNRTNKNKHLPIILIFDEGHYAEYGEYSKILKTLNPEKIVYLSATLNNPNPELSISLPDAIKQKLICRPEIIYRIYDTGESEENHISYESIGEFINEHPEKTCIMLCHQIQEEAKECSDILENMGINSGIYVSDESKEEDLNLQRFREGKLKCLNVVLRTEMGVNVERINMIIFMYQWKSDTRTIQLIGRGTRFHPSKGIAFPVIIPVGIDEYQERKDDMFEILKLMFGKDKVRDNLYIEGENKEVEEKIKDISQFLYEESFNYMNEGEGDNFRKLEEYQRQKEFLRRKDIHNSKYKQYFPNPEVEFEDIKFDWDDYLSRPVHPPEMFEDDIRKCRRDYMYKYKIKSEDIIYEKLADLYLYLPWNEPKI